MATRLRPRPQQQLRPARSTAKQRAEQETHVEQETQREQLTAAKSAVISPATMITQRQSTEMQQTAMHAALSTLAYLRNWFPVHCFDETIYTSADAHWSYEDYAAGKFEAPTVASSHRTPMRVLRRGRSTRVDKLLDWLERGVFDALQKGYLHAMQISIFQDPNHQSNVVESYTFTVNYAPQDPGSAGRKIVSIDMKSPRGSNTTGDILSVQRVRGLMQAFVRQVMASTFGLELLVDEAYLRMHLYYTEECPEEYEPEYFKASTNSDMFFPDNGFVKTSVNVKGMRSGYHAMSFKISHLSPADIENDTNESKTELPRDFQYNTRVSPQDEIEDDDYFQPDGNTVPPAPQETNRAVSKASFRRTSKAALESRASHSEPDCINASSSGTVKGSILPKMDTASFTTRQSQQTPLGKITLPTRRRCKPPATSGSVTTPSPGTQDIQIIQDLQNMNFTQDTQRASDTTQDSALQVQHIPAKSRMQLLQSTIDLLEKHRSVQLGLRRIGPSVRVKLALRNLCGDGEKIRCECGGSHEDNYMLFCSFCNTLQHLYCYGFHSKDDTRLLGDYACYSCLFEERDSANYMNLRSLAVRRRGIHIIEERGYLNDKDFNSVLGCNDAKLRNTLIQQAKKKGYLVSSLGPSKKKGKKMEICEASEAYDRMIREFFDPYTNVENYYKAPHEDGSISLSQSSSQADNHVCSSQKGHMSKKPSPRTKDFLDFLRLVDVGSTEPDEDDDMVDTLRAPGSGMKRGRVPSGRSGSPGPRKKIKSSFSQHHLSMGEYTPSGDRL